MISAEVKNTMADKDYAAAMEQAMPKILTAIGAGVAGQAMLNAPVVTGRLAGSITYAIRGKRSRARRPAKPKDRVSEPWGNDVAYVGTNVEYAQYIEYGTARGVKSKRKAAKIRAKRAQPFLRPALDEWRPRVGAIMQKYVRQALEEGRKQAAADVLHAYSTLGQEMS